MIVLTLSVVAAALTLLVVVLNQAHARIALVEVTLNEGLPPGHELPSATRTESASIDAAAMLGEGVHVFLSRTCHACQRLLDELSHRGTGCSDVTLHYVDRPRPLADQVATALGARLVGDRGDDAARLRADPLPYTICVGPAGLVARRVTPTVSALEQTARDAGIAHGPRSATPTTESPTR